MEIHLGVNGSHGGSFLGLPSLRPHKKRTGPLLFVKKRKIAKSCVICTCKGGGGLKHAWAKATNLLTSYIKYSWLYLCCTVRPQYKGSNKEQCSCLIPNVTMVTFNKCVKCLLHSTKR